MKKNIKKILFISISIVGVLLVLEFISYFGLYFLHSKGIVYNKNKNVSWQFYDEVRDSLLGWPNPHTFGFDSIYDISGSRIIPTFPDPTKNKSVISMYGDSYTFGAEVASEHSIANYLSILLNARVSNYGVGGYGTDQAYLRYMQNTNDSSKIVFLSHFVMNILRNVNQFREVIASAGGLGFKPSFILNNEKLILIPVLDLNSSNFISALDYPEKYFEHDYFINDMSGGYVKFEFPYTFSIIKSFNHFKIKSRLTGTDYYHDFYQLNHESNALKITVAIMEEFVKRAKSRNQIPIILITPSAYSIHIHSEDGKWPYENMISALKNKDIEFVNLGEKIINHSKKLDLCDLYIDCNGHFNENGNRLVAEIIYNYLFPKYEMVLN